MIFIHLSQSWHGKPLHHIVPQYLVAGCRVQVRHPSDKRAKKFLVCTGKLGCCGYQALLHSEPGHQGATYSVASGLGDPPPVVHPHTDVGGPGVLADPGPFPRPSMADVMSAVRHQSF